MGLYQNFVDNPARIAIGDFLQTTIYKAWFMGVLSFSGLSLFSVLLLIAWLFPPF